MATGFLMARSSLSFPASIHFLPIPMVTDILTERRFMVGCLQLHTMVDLA